MQTENRNEIDGVIESLEAAKNELKIKSQILNDKLQEIEKLKAAVAMKENQFIVEINKRNEMEAVYRQKYELQSGDYDKLLSKNQKKDDLLDEYEAQIEAQSKELEVCKEQLRKLRAQIEEKGKLAEEFLEKIQEMESVKADFESTQSANLRSLEKTISGLQSVIVEKERRIKEVEAGINELEAAYQERVRGLENAVRGLSEDNQVKEREVKTLLFEIDKQKKLAKENLANLTKIFS